MESIHEETEQRHTDEMQDIIGTPPSWLLRWGIAIFFSVLVLILSLAELIRYPDVVQTQLKMRSLSLPQQVIVKTPGRLIKLLAGNNKLVKSEQELAIIESGDFKTILTAPQAGKLTYAGILHEKQPVVLNQPLFNININNNDFFGEMIIPQASIGKVKEGQQVMIKLRSYAYEEYGMLHGTIKYIIDNPAKDGEYIAEVDLKNQNITDMNRSLSLKQGMIANAEIITQSSSLFKRLAGNIFKNIKH